MADSTNRGPEAILGQYGRDHWDGPLPTLDAAECDSVEKFMGDQGLSLIAGVIATDGAWQAYHTGELGILSRRTTRNFGEEAVPGPFLQDGVYYPQGIAIWAPRESSSSQGTK